jgi:hypothetical protein
MSSICALYGRFITTRNIKPSKTKIMDYQNTLTPEFCELVQRIEDSGLNAEVIAEALTTMQNHPHASPFLCLQIAASEWDV